MTKYEFLNKLNTLAGSNQVSIVWVPGHLSIHGDVRADELSGIRGVLKTLGTEPLSPIAESVFKQYSKEWAASKSDERSGTTQKMAQKPNLLDKSKEKFLPT